MQLRLLFLALALLIGDTAAGLAGRLAGSLALAAAAVCSAFAQVTGLDGLDVFHSLYLQFFRISSNLSYKYDFVNISH